MGGFSLKLKTGKKHLICIVKSYSLREVEKLEFLTNIYIVYTPDICPVPYGGTPYCTWQSCINPEMPEITIPDKSHTCRQFGHLWEIVCKYGFHKPRNAGTYNSR